MTVKRKHPGRPYRPSNTAERQAPRFLPGDPVTTATGESARVMYSRVDGIVFVELSDGRKVALHEDALQFAPGFVPLRRR